MRRVVLPLHVNASPYETRRQCLTGSPDGRQRDWWLRRGSRLRTGDLTSSVDLPLAEDDENGDEETADDDQGEPAR